MDVYYRSSHRAFGMTEKAFRALLTLIGTGIAGLFTLFGRLLM
ncbi:hypothetical protein [Belnapia moabensis]|nr:hypothetical protein [Belnapia moabensis]